MKDKNGIEKKCSKTVAITKFVKNIQSQFKLT